MARAAKQAELDEEDGGAFGDLDAPDAEWRVAEDDDDDDEPPARSAATPPGPGVALGLQVVAGLVGGASATLAHQQFQVGSALRNWLVVPAAGALVAAVVAGRPRGGRVWVGAGRALTAGAVMLIVASGLFDTVLGAAGVLGLTAAAMIVGGVSAVNRAADAELRARDGAWVGLGLGGLVYVVVIVLSGHDWGQFFGR